MSLLLPDSGLLFWMLLSFGVVFVVLAKYGFPVITKMVEGRKTYIDQSLEVAREANAQLSKLKEESEALIAAANKEQGRILREAMHERDKIIVEARKQAEAAAQKELDEVKKADTAREGRGHPRYSPPGGSLVRRYSRENYPQESGRET